MLSRRVALQLEADSGNEAENSLHHLYFVSFRAQDNVSKKRKIENEENNENGENYSENRKLRKRDRRQHVHKNIMRLSFMIATLSNNSVLQTCRQMSKEVS